MNKISQNENHFAQTQLTLLIKMSKDYAENTIPEKDNFKKIFNKAKNKNITLDNAKKFLKSLSKKELNSIKEYSYLTNTIEINKLDNEGAYNLLLHHYEKFDFNKDGIVLNGNSKIRSLLPINMPCKEKKAISDGLQEIEEKDKLTILLMINPPKIFIHNNGKVNIKEDNMLMNKDEINRRMKKVIDQYSLEFKNNSTARIFKIFEENFNKSFHKEINMGKGF